MHKEPGSSGWLELQPGVWGESLRRAREAINSWIIRGKKQLPRTGEGSVTPRWGEGDRSLGAYHADRGNYQYPCSKKHPPPILCFSWLLSCHMELPTCDPTGRAFSPKLLTYPRFALVIFTLSEICVLTVGEQSSPERRQPGWAPRRQKIRKTARRRTTVCSSCLLWDRPCGSVV